MCISAVNVSVRMRSGDVLSIPDIGGSQLTGQLVEEIGAKVDATGDSSNSITKLLLSTSFSTQNNLEHSTNTNTGVSVQSGSPQYHLQSEEASELYNSLWAGAPSKCSRTAVDPQAALTKEVLYLRFGNVFSDIMTGLHRYSEQGAQRVPLGSLHVSTVTIIHDVLCMLFI